jgi:hypothetical protein
LRATKAQLSHALAACRELNPVYRRLIKLALQNVQLIEHRSSNWIRRLRVCSTTTRMQSRARLAEVPGLGIDSAHQIIAEVGATAETFESAKKLAS